MNIQVEPVADPQLPQVTTVGSNPNPVEHLAIADRFNIQTPTKEENEKLSMVWNYVKSSGDERSVGDVIWDVINLEMTLGSPRLGETRLDKLYKYVKLRINEARIQEQLRHVANSPDIH